LIEGVDRRQATLFPERLDDYIAEDGAVDARMQQIPEVSPSRLALCGAFLFKRVDYR